MCNFCENLRVQRGDAALERSFYKHSHQNRVLPLEKGKTLRTKSPEDPYGT
jgi:hypothetical protein